MMPLRWSHKVAEWRHRAPFPEAPGPHPRRINGMANGSSPLGHSP